MEFDRKTKWIGIDEEIEHYKKAIKEHQKEKDFLRGSYTPKELFERIIKVLKRVKKNIVEK